jgi:hypothetical protein
MIDQLPMAVVVVNAPIIGALTTCHPRLCYSPPVDRERRCRFTSGSVTNCRRLRFSSQDVGSKQAETDQPTLGGRLLGLRGTGHTAAPTTLALCGHVREHRQTRLTKHQAVEPSDRQTIAPSYWVRACLRRCFSSIYERHDPYVLRNLTVLKSHLPLAQCQGKGARNE